MAFTPGQPGLCPVGKLALCTLGRDWGRQRWGDEPGTGLPPDGRLALCHEVCPRVCHGAAHPSERTLRGRALHYTSDQLLASLTLTLLPASSPGKTLMCAPWAPEN